MIDALLASCTYCCEWIVRATDDLAETERARMFPGLPNHPAWTLGHLLFSVQAIGGELDFPAWLDASWKSRFGPGSAPIADAAAYPPLAELRRELRAASQRLREHLAARPAAFLAEPLPDARFRSLLPTRGHAALQVLVGHAAFHAGQLAAWRRAAGRSNEPFV